MIRSLSYLLPLALAPLTMLAAAPVSKHYAKKDSSFAVEVSATTPSRTNTGSLAGVITLTENFSLALGLPSKTDIKVDYGTSVAYDLEYTTVPLSLRYESPLTTECNYVFNTETTYYYVDNKLANTNGHSFGYSLDFGFSVKLNPCDKLLFLSTLYRHQDPKLSDNSGDINYYLSGSKIAFQHRF